MPIIVEWILSIGLFLSIKYGYGTTYGSLYCIDGYSVSYESTLGYLITSSVLSILVPFTAITIIYLHIRHILTQNTIRVSSTIQIGQLVEQENQFSTADNNASKNKIVKKSTDSKKNKRFNLQLISLNICYIICFTMSFILSFRYIIRNFNERFYYFRQLFRIVNIFSQAMIPVVSLVFNPNLTLEKVLSNIVYPIK